MNRVALETRPPTAPHAAQPRLAAMLARQLAAHPTHILFRAEREREREREREIFFPLVAFASVSPRALSVYTTRNFLLYRRYEYRYRIYMC